MTARLLAAALIVLHAWGEARAEGPAPVVPVPPPPAPPAAVIAGVDLQGKLLEPKEQLAKVLGLVAGAPYDRAAEERVLAALDALGYLLADQGSAPSPDGRGVIIRLKLEPAHVVRHVIVKG